jgi:hypothetical protein
MLAMRNILLEAQSPALTVDPPDISVNRDVCDRLQVFRRLASILDCGAGHAIPAS